MGVAPSSLGATLKSMSDEELTCIVQEAFQVDPLRMDKIVTSAKREYLRAGGVLPAPPIVSASPGTESLPTPSIAEMASSSQPPPSSSEAPTLLPVAPSRPPQIIETNAHVVAMPTSLSSDRMAALWTFEGHTLRELKCGSVSKKRSLSPSPAQEPGTESTSSTASHGGVDEEGNPILYGSCGREKKYARCSVCYFRGARCNTAHYCGCCQRPVCIRPRTYPGEEQPKICWNVLHMDSEMIQRVDKRRAQKRYAASLVVEKALDPTTTGTDIDAYDDGGPATVARPGGVDDGEEKANVLIAPTAEADHQIGALSEMVEPQAANQSTPDPPVNDIVIASCSSSGSATI